ncbi:MAG: hypothetical protein J6A05_06475, partial [Oscillospiraceae bacterium]|nr:hypothetical protein [Oscillospiraceae bacterium]
MKKLVKFRFESDVICGGIKTNNNFIKSVDIINGAVLRAAFANDILLDCKFADEAVDGKKYQVVYRKQKCEGCKHENVCKKFSDMTFSFLIPENSMPAPFTARTCKAHGTAHPIMDTVMESGMLRCKGCGGRMENLKGIIDRDTFSTVRIPHSSTTHTAINHNTRTAKTGSLFSVEAIRKGCIYECEIDDLDSGMLCEEKVVYIGKYSSSGFGKIKIISIEDVAEYDVEKTVDEFNEKFKEKEGLNYASVLFLSDAKLDINQTDNTPKTETEYREIWKERLFGKDAPVEVEQVYAQNYMYNGYEMSSGEYKVVPEMLTEKGSSIKVSFKCKD